MKKTITLLLAALALNQGNAQTYVSEKAKHFEFEIHTVSKGTSKSDNLSTYQFNLIGKDGANNVYECKLVKAQIRESNDGKYKSLISLNTDSIRKFQYNSTNVFMPLAILDRPLKVTVSPFGKLLKVEGLTEAVNSAADIWGLSNDIRKQLLENLNSYPFRELNNFFLTMPAKKSDQVGLKSIEPAWDYKITDSNGDLLIIKSNKSKENIQKNYSYNKATGLLEHGTIISKYNSAPDFKINAITTIKLSYKQNSYKPDTAWLNMALKMSYWSNSLKNGIEYDSAKVYRFFKANDALYFNDGYYRVNQLGLMQQFRSSKSYLKYDSALIAIPNHFIADQRTHLHNKIGRGLYQSADSSYAISKYLYKFPGFSEWLQYSFSQSFLERNKDDDEGFKKAVRKEGWTEAQINDALDKGRKERVNTKTLIYKFHNSDIPEIRQQTEGLYLWVNAENNYSDPGVLKTAADRLMQMNSTEIKKTNGGRYSLIIYNKLLDARKPNEADMLLTKTIGKLETLVADTLNTERYAHQYLLAYAYHAQYVATKKTDSVKALQYLSKASQYSVKEKKEKAYASFYDRLFLRDAKESYREEFMETLFKNSNTTEALRIFIDHVNANPQDIDEMQKVYLKHFPGQDFKKFFADKIIAAWQPAPSFVLKDLDGKGHALADYKNKWLVLDFWGTWCSPCREEMPHINTFNKELADGKHSSVNFLSIACSDTKDRVKTYFDLTKFIIPVVMSNSTVEKQYKILGYPSKIIIAPNGKMLSLNFGTDWVAVIDKFSNLYAAN